MGSISPVSSAHEPCTRRSRSPSPFLLHFFTTDFLNRLLFTVVVVVFTLTQLPFARAALQNATVDDEYGDSLTKTKPRFLPSAAGVWEGEECAGCRVKPDPTRTFRNTYLAATYRKDDGVDPVEFSFQFTGSALYVFLTLAHNCGEGITTRTETNFTIDDGPPTFFNHTPNMSRTDFDYQFPAFVQEGLEHRTHTFKATTSGPDYHIFINFDYAIYTYDDTLIGGVVGTAASPTGSSTTSTSTSSTTSTSSSNSKSNSLAGPIAGGVVGGLAIFGAFIFALLFIRRRTRRRASLYLDGSDYPNGAGAVGATSSGRRGRKRKEEPKEYPNPEIFAFTGHLNDNRHARSEYTTMSGHPPITPFTYNAVPSGSTHSLGGPTQGTGSSMSGSGSGSGSGGAMYPPAPYGTGAGRGSGRGRGGNTSPQPVRKHRVGGSGGAASDNTGLSYITDLRTREPALPMYTPNPPPNSSQQHLNSHPNHDVVSMGSGSGSSMSGNPYGGIEESVYAATGVRLDPMPARPTYYATNPQASNPSLRGGPVPPPPGAGGAAQPTSNLDAQMHALQDSIRLIISNLQAERDALRARGVSNEAIQQDGGLEKMTESLRRMAEEMSVLQERRRGGGGGGDHVDESRRTMSTQPPGYESWGQQG